MVTNAFSGRSARARRSRFAAGLAKSRDPLPEFRQLYALSGPIEEVAADDEALFQLYGQAASLNRKVLASDLFRGLIAETAEIFGKLSKAFRCRRE